MAQSARILLVDDDPDFSEALRDRLEALGFQVTVALGPGESGLARLDVRDTGPGIPPEDRERVFDKFYQVGRVDGGQRPPGSGLGLTIARHLVELHGGRVWVEPGHNGGSAFVVLLPTSAPDLR